MWKEGRTLIRGMKGNYRRTWGPTTWTKQPANARCMDNDIKGYGQLQYRQTRTRTIIITTAGTNQGERISITTLKKPAR